MLQTFISNILLAGFMVMVSEWLGTEENTMLCGFHPTHYPTGSTPNN